MVFPEFSQFISEYAPYLAEVAAKLGYGDLGDLTPEDVAFEVIKRNNLCGK